MLSGVPGLHLTAKESRLQRKVRDLKQTKVDTVNACRVTYIIHWPCTKQGIMT